MEPGSPAHAKGDAGSDGGGEVTHGGAAAGEGRGGGGAGGATPRGWRGGAVVGS